MVKNYDWPDETVERLKKLWGDGISASTIAMRLGHGLTRNAIIGKVSRLKLPGRRTTSMMQGKRSAKQRLYRRPSPPQAKPLTPLQLLMRDRAPLPPPVETDIARVSFDDLEHGKHCKFIPGDPGDDFKLDKPLYCGLKLVPGLPYCHAHAVRCHNPPELKVRIRIPSAVTAKEFA